ncbi:hypothetical protein N7471_006692 [Penicillium samsonianum]|uniref:uncharacterized protein n=1 Tax=Penicillium samsonianum TaxID=1882272 RepID=UPI0025479DBA|nr:uncharacterized protein N7471_006692 [Penicillium samsonianum]KAJ6140206.1 hypothetical protein N7471_006692 [Penicillium samsonianum]
MATRPHQIFPREAIQSCLPELLLASNRTESSAMHRITYVGPLHQWLNFEAKGFIHPTVVPHDHALDHPAYRTPMITITSKKAHSNVKIVPTTQPADGDAAWRLTSFGVDETGGGVVADETGLQGRFEQALGQVLGGIFRAEGVNMLSANFKSAGTSYNKSPDIRVAFHDTKMFRR